MVHSRRKLVVSVLLALTFAFGRNAQVASAAPVASSSESNARSAVALRAATQELSEWVTQQKGQLSLYVGSADSASALASVNANHPLNPASNTKILTMLAALHELGPEFRFHTGLCGRITANTVDSLGIVSNGDPTLDRAAMLDLAFQMVQQGVRQVKGIVVDQSAFDANFVPPAFEQQPNEWSPFRAPVSAVAFNGNSVSVSVSPTEATQPARVTAFPSSFLDLVVTARTRRAKDKAARIDVTPSATKLGLRLRISGTLSEAAAPVTLWRRIDDPSTFAGYALADSLRALGVQLPSPVPIELGKCDGSPELATRSSPALSTIMHQLGKDSDNFVAEMLVKAMGAHASGKPGTSTDGLAVVRELAHKIHPLAEGSRLVNGSGLFDANRISAEQLAAVLRFARTDPRLGPEFVSSLAIAGRDGTLRKRLATSSSAIVRAKTGTLKHTVSLSGYLQTSIPATPWVFSVIINDIESIEQARHKLDAFLLRVIEPVRPPA